MCIVISSQVWQWEIEEETLSDDGGKEQKDIIVVMVLVSIEAVAMTLG